MQTKCSGEKERAGHGFVNFLYVLLAGNEVRKTVGDCDPMIDGYFWGDLINFASYLVLILLLQCYIDFHRVCR